MSSPLGIRVNIELICRRCELEISGILITVDLRVMDMSEFDVIFGVRRYLWDGLVDGIPSRH